MMDDSNSNETEGIDKNQVSSELAKTTNLVSQSSISAIKQPSVVWKYFVKQTDISARCNLCNTNFKHGGNTTNLRQHLKRKHKLLYNTDLTNNEKHKALVDNAPLPKKVKLQPKETVSRIDEAFQRANSFKNGGKNADKITNAVLYMIAVDHMPLSVVENDGFNLLMKTVSPLYNLPSRKTITKLIKARYDMLKESFKTNLQGASSYTLTCDIWTDISNQSYLGITVHYRSVDLAMKRGCVGVFPLNTHHTAEYIANSLLSVMENFNLDEAKITAIVSDSASNMKKAINSINKQKQLRCFAHTISHLVPDTLSTMPTTRDIITKMKTIVGLTRRSVVASDELKRLQIRDGKSEGTTLKFIQDCPTRWNSTFFMLDRFLQLEEYVYPVISKCPNAPNMLSREEIQVLKDLVLLSKPIENVIRDISGDSYSTCNIIIPIVHCMKATIQNTAVSTILGEEFKEKLLAEIQNRFKDFELNLILAISTILDPRFKKLHFQSALAASSAITRINNLIKGTAVENKENLKVLNERTQTQTNVWDFHDNLVAKNIDYLQKNKDDTLNIELRHYLQQPVISREIDVCKHWESLKNTFPSLYTLAWQYGSAIATSVPAERLFSSAGRIKSDDRNRLTGEHLNQLLFLGSLSREEWGV